MVSLQANVIPRRKANGCARFGHWLLEYATSRKAIVITADYRMLPEANALDILQDIRDLFDWIATPNNLEAHLPPGIAPDLDHLLVTGESAGGWLALQAALLPAPRRKISAVIARYPMIDMRDPHYTEDYEKHLFTPTAPQLDRSILKNYLKSMKAGDVVTTATPPDRVPLVISFMQQGVYKTHFGDDGILYPLEVLDTVDDLPPTWIFHGDADTVIPVDGTHKYEKLLKEKLPDAKVRFHYEKDADHGFDNASSVSLDTEWVKDGVDFISQYWPER